MRSPTAERLAPPLLRALGVRSPQPRRARVLRRRVSARGDRARRPCRVGLRRRPRGRGSRTRRDLGRLRGRARRRPRPRAARRDRRLHRGVERHRCRRRRCALRDRVGSARHLAHEARGTHALVRLRAELEGHALLRPARRTGLRARGALAARPRAGRAPRTRTASSPRPNVRCARTGSCWTASSSSRGRGRDEPAGRGRRARRALARAARAPDPPAAHRHHDRGLHVRARGSDRRRARDQHERGGAGVVARADLRAPLDAPDSNRPASSTGCASRPALRSGGRRRRT